MPTVDASPSSFTFDGTAVSVTIAVPSGVYASAQWRCAGVSDWLYQERIGTGGGYGHRATWTAHTGAWDETISATADQLADINAAAGGTLNAEFTTAISVPYPSSDIISSLQLVLPGAGVGGSFTRHLQPVSVTVLAVPQGVAADRYADLPTVSVATRARAVEGAGAAGRTVELPTVSVRPFAPSGTSGPGGGDTSGADGDGGGVIVETGSSILFSQFRDMTGEDSTSEVLVGSGARNQAAHCRIGPDWLALYTRGGVVYRKRTTNPDDWSGAAEVDTGIRGAVFGAGANRGGVVCVVIDGKSYTSRDGGTTWGAGVTIGLPTGTYDCAVLVVDDLFTVAYSAGGAPRSKSSLDGGASWA